MIAADSSSLIAFFAGDKAADTAAIASAAIEEQLSLPPIVQFEIFSGAVPATHRDLIANATLLELQPGYWQRAGLMRLALQKRGLKARAADCLIAQCCIDADVSLITRDRDFRHFATHCGLKLAV
ncbi:PIN domain-containing protein [uncultured Brevundimonas sp.]|uniref:PIN domain-containing protein n=1 Tax=uncultured Brevundimonas sp. TaxID=213418 RepID=UPI0030EDE429